MECVSRTLLSSNPWPKEINAFWKAVLSDFTPRRNLSCGTHVHVAPWNKKFTLKQAQAIAFACCYYEPYIISCMPMERRDNRYCRRNTRVVGLMGRLYKKQTPAAMAQIASKIKQMNNFKAIIKFMQGGLTHHYRYVLWNFQNLTKSGTVEFRGGRHVRGPVRTRRWITFVIVFIIFALHEVRKLFQETPR
jgi:hypothetical protein